MSRTWLHGSRMAGVDASSSLPRAPAKVRSQTDLPTLALARQPFLGQESESDRREPVTFKGIITFT